MAEETPRLIKLVGEKDQSHSSSVFDDLEGLRKASKLSVKRRAVLGNVEVDKPASNSYFRAHPTWVLDDATVVRDAEGYGRTRSDPVCSRHSNCLACRPPFPPPRKLQCGT
jgi:hypothetical protein